MWTLKLLITGVAFLLPDPTVNPSRLFVLLLNPADIDGKNHHTATMTVSSAFVAAGSRLPDSFGSTVAAFKLSDEQLAVTKGKDKRDELLTGLSLASGTRDGKKPGSNSAAKATLQHQREDTAWVHSLADLVADVPASDAAAKELRTDLKNADFTDPLVLARVEIENGYVRTNSLWGEKGDPFHANAATIGGYCFKEESVERCPADEAVAVAETVAVDISVNGTVMFASRRLSDHTMPGKGAIYLTAPDSAVVTVVLASTPDEHGLDTDIDAFYGLLKDHTKLAYLPRALANAGTDEGGACSPRKP